MHKYAHGTRRNKYMMQQILSWYNHAYAVKFSNENTSAKSVSVMRDTQLLHGYTCSIKLDKMHGFTETSHKMIKKILTRSHRL